MTNSIAALLLITTELATNWVPHGTVQSQTFRVGIAFRPQLVTNFIYEVYTNQEPLRFTNSFPGPTLRETWVKPANEERRPFEDFLDERPVLTIYGPMPQPSVLRPPIPGKSP